ncbi:MAG: hypothetical protein KDA63_18685 [Planctomycetales bacterium]|nr:hypothetical protein [Planctomycetales bacterium]
MDDAYIPEDLDEAHASIDTALWTGRHYPMVSTMGCCLNKVVQSDTSFDLDTLASHVDVCFEQVPTWRAQKRVVPRSLAAKYAIDPRSRHPTEGRRKEVKWLINVELAAPTSLSKTAIQAIGKFP